MKKLRAQVLVHRVPVEVPVRTSFGTMTDRPSLLIRLEDEGAVGWGEVWCNFPSVGAEHRARLLCETILPLVAEHETRPDPAALWSILTQRLSVLAIQSGEPGPIAQCLAGLEAALTDLEARRAGKPLWVFLREAKGDTASADETGNNVGVYASGINPSGVGASVRRALEAGHLACKVKIGFGHDLDRANLEEARAVLGPDRALMADANQGWSPAAAASFAPHAGEFDLVWLEEPLRHDAPDAAWLNLAAAMTTPLAAGENFASLAEFTHLPNRRGLRILQPDVGKWGGVAMSMKVAAQAATRDLLFCPHWLGGGVGLLTSLHIKAAAGAGTGHVEVDVNPNPMRDTVSTSVMATLRNGRVTLGDVSGIGDVEAAVASFEKFRLWSRAVEC